MTKKSYIKKKIFLAFNSRVFLLDFYVNLFQLFFVCIKTNSTINCITPWFCLSFFSIVTKPCKSPKIVSVQIITSEHLTKSVINKYVACIYFAAENTGLYLIIQ